MAYDATLEAERMLKEGYNPAPTPSVLPGVKPMSTNGGAAPNNTGTPSYSRVPAPVVSDDVGMARSILTNVKSEADIVAGEKSRAIDGAQERAMAINKVYDKEREEIERTTNAQNTGRTNALSALMGLTGSSAAESRSANTEAINSKNVELIEAKRANELTALYGEIDSNAQKAIDAALKANKENAKALLDEVVANSKGHIQGLAATLGGASWDEFKQTDPATASTLLKNAGISEFEAQKLWNDSVPEQYRPITSDALGVSANGTALIYRSTFNPVTKKATTAQFDTGVPYALYKDAKVIKGDNGSNFIPDPNDPTGQRWINITPQTPEELEKLGLESEKLRSEIFKNYNGGGGGGNEDLVNAVLENPELFNQLTPTEKARITPSLNERGFTAFGKPLSDTAIQSLTQSQTALEGLKDLKQSVKENEQYIGPIAGLAALNPYSKARQVQASVDRIRQRVGKALEGGVLRKEDEEKYKKILATLTDTPDTAIAKIDQLINDVEREIGTFTKNQSIGGRNTSGLGEPQSSPDGLSDDDAYEEYLRAIGEQ